MTDYTMTQRIDRIITALEQIATELKKMNTERQRTIKEASERAKAWAAAHPDE